MMCFHEMATELAEEHLGLLNMEGGCLLLEKASTAIGCARGCL